MRLAAALVGDLREYMAREARNADRAVTAAVTTHTAGLKDDLRRRVEAAGLSRRLAFTWQGKVYPQGQQSINSAGWVYSKAPEIVGAHARGATIRAKGGRFLAIPLPAAGKSGREHMTPKIWERNTGMKLRFVPRRRGGGLLVLDRGRLTKRGVARVAGARAKVVATVPLFVLVPQVTLRKRFDVDGPARVHLAALPAAVVAEWDRLSGK